jgi:hypothetical protein
LASGVKSPIVGRVTGLQVLLLLAGAAQEPADRLVFADRSELRGGFGGVDPSGALVFRDAASARVLRVSPEDVWKLAFEGDADEKAGEESVRLYAGGGLSGRRVRFEKDEALVEHPAGLLRVRRSEIRSITLVPPASALPEIKDGTEDVVIREDDTKRLVAETGRLLAIHDVLLLRSGGAEKSLPRASIRQILLRGDGPKPEAPAGWFARLAFRNGDKVVGVLRSAGPGKVALYSPALGAVELERRHLRSLTFTPTARLSLGHLLVCDQWGVRELDRQGREIWGYQHNAQYAWSARKLENGNVLVANTNFNQVIEIRPTGRTSGEVVWRLDQANYPYDATRLENGNTLVAEHETKRVVEYDAKLRPVWQHAIDHPQSAQRLENGNTLICTNALVVEVDGKGRERWRLAAGNTRPYRATRLENGNTLVVEHVRGRVIEFNPQSVAVWEADKLARPVEAIRLDDGGTLILEQGGNRVLEIDAAGVRRPMPGVRDLRYPQGMSLY